MFELYLKIEKRRMAKTTVAEGHPRRRANVVGDSAMRLLKREGLCVSVDVRVTVMIRAFGPMV